MERISLVLLPGFERFLGHPACGLVILMALSRDTLTAIRTSAVTRIPDSKIGDNTLVAELVFFHFSLVVPIAFDVNYRAVTLIISNENCALLICICLQNVCTHN
jgi:hypothetical protein